jgi:hypothetical protein
MKTVIAFLLVSALTACTQVRYRSHECDSLFYGQYQSMGEPKALAFAIPAADPRTPTEYETRCWARAAAGNLPHGMSAEEAMSVVVAGVLSDCNSYKNENNSLRKANELDCRVAAKNLVWEPWVQELRVADARARGDDTESVQFYAVAGNHGQATAPTNSGQIPPATAAAATTVLPPAAYADSAFTPSRFHDEFEWCSGPKDSCTQDHFIEIRNPGEGRLVGRLAIYIRPEGALDDRLNYTVQFDNESQCKIVIEGNSIMQGGKTLGAWVLQSDHFEPAQMQSTSELITFPEGASGRASISISGRVEDCRP